MKLEQAAIASVQAQKGNQGKKDAIANIDWSLDSRRIVVCFKLMQMIVVWDVKTCQRVF